MDECIDIVPANSGGYQVKIKEQKLAIIGQKQPLYAKECTITQLERYFTPDQVKIWYLIFKFKKWQISTKGTPTFSISPSNHIQINNLLVPLCKAQNLTLASVAVLWVIFTNIHNKWTGWFQNKKRLPQLVFPQGSRYLQNRCLWVNTNKKNPQIE